MTTEAQTAQSAGADGPADIPLVEHKIGSTITISRGTHRNKRAEILAFNKDKAEYAVRTEDGALVVIWQGNVRENSERTITESQLLGILRERGAHRNSPSVLALDALLPGFCDHFEREESATDGTH